MSEQQSMAKEMDVETPFIDMAMELADQYAQATESSAVAEYSATAEEGEKAFAAVAPARAALYSRIYALYKCNCELVTAIESSREMIVELAKSFSGIGPEVIFGWRAQEQVEELLADIDSEFRQIFSNATVMPQKEVAAYRMEQRPGNYSFMDAKHWSYNSKHYAGARVHELHLGRMIQNPGVDIEAAAVFPSLWKGVRPDCGPSAEEIPHRNGRAPLDLDQMRAEFEDAALAYAIERQTAGKVHNNDNGAPMTKESLFWRKEDGEYGVVLFNPAWWAWQAAMKAVKHA